MDSMAFVLIFVFRLSLLSFIGIKKGLCVTCTKPRRLNSQGPLSSNSTQNQPIFLAVASSGVNEATEIDDEIYECSSGCCDGKCCKEQSEYERLGSPAFMFLMLLCGSFSVFLMLKLILSSQTCRSLLLARFINTNDNNSDRRSSCSQTTSAYESNMANAEPPDYLTCIQPDSRTVTIETRNSRQPCTSPATSGSLPAYDAVFKDEKARINKVAVINQSGEVIFKSYAEAFPNLSGRMGEILEEDKRS